MYTNQDSVQSKKEKGTREKKVGRGDVQKQVEDLLWDTSLSAYLSPE